MRRLKTIQSSMILTFTLLLLATILLLGTLSFYLFSNVIKDNAEVSTAQLITQLNNVIDTYIDYMIDISNVAAESAAVQELVGLIHPEEQGFSPPFSAEKRTPTADRPELPSSASAQDRAESIEYSRLKREIGIFFNSLLTIRNDISAIALLLDNRDAVISSPDKQINPAVDITSVEGFVKLMQNPDAIYLSSGHVQNLIRDEYPWVISLGRSVVDSSGQFAGILMVDLNYELIEEICEEIELGSRGYVFVINELGDIVYHPRQQLIYSNLKMEYIDVILEMRNGSRIVELEGEQVLYTMQTSNRTGWTLVGVSYLEEMNSYKSQLSTIYILLAVLGFSLLVLLSFILSSRISSPIEHLRESMREVERGNFNIEIDVKADNEISDLARDCRIAIGKIRDLLEQNERDQENKRLNELKALQAQINPHFLYNTLDSIIWMAECGLTQEVVDMTTALAEFFRLGISKGSEIVSVRSMVEHIRSYLVIQNMRYKDKLDYVIDIDPEVYQFRTLKLLIQPLVENSIYHGLKEKDSGGMIWIRGRREGKLLIFEVEDNGAGIGEESLEELIADRSDRKTGSGVGIRNVQERIKLFFGQEYGLRYYSEPGKGTIFTLTLPIIEPQDTEAAHLRPQHG